MPWVWEEAELTALELDATPSGGSEQAALGDAVGRPDLDRREDPRGIPVRDLDAQLMHRRVTVRAEAVAPLRDDRERRGVLLERRPEPLDLGLGRLAPCVDAEVDDNLAAA